MLTILFSFLLISGGNQQTTPPTPAELRQASYEIRKTLEYQSPFRYPRFKAVGPVACGGRIVDIEGFSEFPYKLYVAYASAGLWKTDNNGSTWQQLFDRTPSITIGDIAIHPDNPAEIWVGSGEPNSSRSSYAGTGVYRSRNAGKTWENVGLWETHHIGRILIHPQDPKTVYVAAIGRLYTPNAERGVFKTTDGGRTWQHVLFIDEHTGIIDLAFDPGNSDRLYAAAWQRERKAWEFTESGPASGFWISEDAGQNWRPSDSGLPTGEHLGRLGIAVSASHPNVIYLSVDNQLEKPVEDSERDKLNRRNLEGMSAARFLEFSDEELEKFLRDNHFHKEYTSTIIRDKLGDGEITMQDLVDYIYDGNAALFDREVLGVEIYRSDDFGASWQKTHSETLDDFVFTYGYYFGEICVSPLDPETIYVFGVPLLKSIDGGKTFVNINEPNVHVDHHAMWIDPKDPSHLVLGNDGGLNISYDGVKAQHVKGVPAGQFYTVAYDTAEPYRIYGGLQDNGVWRGTAAELKPGCVPWTQLGSGDGAFVEVDPRDNETVYWGYQFGHYTRLNVPSGSRHPIFPRHKLKERPYRYNWMTPIELSNFTPDFLYIGANKVLRSLDRGETWIEISPDLTTDPPQGDVPFATITALRESPHEFGTLYAGTDDGRVWMTRGGSPFWTEITAGLPQGLWVSSIEVSQHDPKGVYLTLTGYRNDDFRTYVFASQDYGRTWEDIQSNLPHEPCNVIRQDGENGDILYLGTDLGLWITLDRGKQWFALQPGLPNVPVYALEIHPREDLIAATHGLSVFVLDLEVIQQLSPEVLGSESYLFEPQVAICDKESWGADQRTWWGKYSDAPHSDICFFVREKQTVEVLISREKVRVFETSLEAEPGIQHVEWDYQVTTLDEKSRSRIEAFTGDNGKAYVPPGEYEIVLKSGSKKSQRILEIKPSD